MNRTASLIITAILCSSCSFLNPLLTSVAFKDYANKAIGKNVDQYTKYPPMLPINIVSVENSQTEYHLMHEYTSSQSGRIYQCIWAVTAENESKKIVSWHYVSQASACKDRYFYEGAW